MRGLRKPPITSCDGAICKDADRPSSNVCEWRVQRRDTSTNQSPCSMPLKPSVTSYLRIPAGVVPHLLSSRRDSKCPTDPRCALNAAASFCSGRRCARRDLCRYRGSPAGCRLDALRSRNRTSVADAAVGARLLAAGARVGGEGPDRHGAGLRGDDDLVADVRAVRGHPDLRRWRAGAWVPEAGPLFPSPSIPHLCGRRRRGDRERRANLPGVEFRVWGHRRVAVGRRRHRRGCARLLRGAGSVGGNCRPVRFPAPGESFVAEECASRVLDLLRRGQRGGRPGGGGCCPDVGSPARGGRGSILPLPPLRGLCEPAGRGPSPPAGRRLRRAWDVGPRFKRTGHDLERRARADAGMFA